jgi:hypothetical protein
MVFRRVDNKTSSPSTWLASVLEICVTGSARYIGYLSDDQTTSQPASPGKELQGQAIVSQISLYLSRPKMRQILPHSYFKSMTNNAKIAIRVFNGGDC